MAARQRAAMRPLDAALVRLQALAARGVKPTRMAREVEMIVSEWLGEAGADPDEVKTRLDELHEQLASGVVDPASDVGIAGSGGIRCSSPAGGCGHGYSAGVAGGFVEQPHSASVEARAASSKALDFTCMLLGLGLTVGLFGGQARFQGIATGLGLLESH